MIKKIKLLQAKYSLSDEYIVEFIKNEIHRQAIQDLEGAMRNASISKLEEIVSCLSADPLIKNFMGLGDLYAKDGKDVTDIKLSGSSEGSTGKSEDDVPGAVQPRGNSCKAKHKSK